MPCPTKKANQLWKFGSPSAYGDRLTQNGVNYTLDLNAGLTQVLNDGTNQYLYGLGRISQVNTTTEYFLTDALGSTRQLTDAQGAVTLANAHELGVYPEPRRRGTLAQTAGAAQTSYGFTGEFTDPSGMVYLRARYYTPNDGRFLTRDTWMGDYNNPLSLNRWMYVEGNPVNYTDPTGFTVQDPLTATQWDLAKQEAIRFGIPKELVASTLAAEIVYDEDLINVGYDVSTAVVGGIADLAFILSDRTTYNLCYQLLDGFHEYFGLAPWLEKQGFGYGSAPGIANMHAGPAVRTEEYINRTYPGQDLMPDLGLDNHPGVRLRTLLTDEGGIRYAAGYLRWYADLRKGTTTDHTNDLSDADMIIIYTGYRCSIEACYGSLQGFQDAEEPSSFGSPDDFSVFLDLYKKKP